MYGDQDEWDEGGLITISQRNNNNNNGNTKANGAPDCNSHRMTTNKAEESGKIWCPDYTEKLKYERESVKEENSKEKLGLLIFWAS